MKIIEIINEKSLSILPISFRYFEPISKKSSKFRNNLVSIKKYQTDFTKVSQPLKPISKILNKNE